jgi:hypothetical protein
MIHYAFLFDDRQQIPLQTEIKQSVINKRNFIKRLMVIKCEKSKGVHSSRDRPVIHPAYTNIRKVKRRIEIV